MRRGRLTAARLAEVVGVEAARAIVEEFGGRLIPASAERLDRDLEICAALDDGATYGEVAARFGLSRSTVAEISLRCSAVTRREPNSNDTRRCESAMVQA